MLHIDKQNIILVGPAGSITVPKEDEITSKLAMLYEGECEGLGPTHASKKYGYSKHAISNSLPSILSKAPYHFKVKKDGRNLIRPSETCI